MCPGQDITVVPTRTEHLPLHIIRYISLTGNPRVKCDTAASHAAGAQPASQRARVSWYENMRPYGVGRMTTGAAATLDGGQLRVNDTSGPWRIDPASLRDIVLDREALERALAAGCPPTDRVRFLSLLGRESEALREGFGLVNDSPERRDLLLVLASVLQRLYRWHEAAVLQEEALQLASSRAEEAYVRYHIGRRLFDEARYRDAAAEFQWSSDLYHVSGDHHLAEQSSQAMARARHAHSTSRPIDSRTTHIQDPWNPYAN